MLPNNIPAAHLSARSHKSCCTAAKPTTLNTNCLHERATRNTKLVSIQSRILERVATMEFNRIKSISSNVLRSSLSVQPSILFLYRGWPRSSYGRHASSRCYRHVVAHPASEPPWSGRYASSSCMTSSYRHCNRAVIRACGAACILPTLR